jgi:DNA repair protein RadD
MFEPRTYQRAAIDGAVNYFKGNTNYNAFEILPTGSGKSVVIANVAKELQDPTLVFQPSKEILQQNLAKFMSYGYRAGVYSASVGMKRVEQITFATIGSVHKKSYLFREFKNIIVDECHQVNPKDGMYNNFIRSLPDAKVLGLTATPYRLSVDRFNGAMLKFINRTKPRIFDHCLYYVQNRELFDSGHLCKLEYYEIDKIDRKALALNKSGTDFTEASIRAEYKRVRMPKWTAHYANRLLEKRKNLLVFCSLVDEAMEVMQGVPGAKIVTGETPAKERDMLLSQFKAGRIRCMINVGVLTTGFDFPALECVLLARSTMSLALYYQMVGRAMRIDPGKESAWIVDLGGNVKCFGHIESMSIETSPNNLMSIWNKGRQLTNVSFFKSAA